MQRTLCKSSIVGGILLVVVAVSSTPVCAQGFLDKLEKAVKEQLEGNPNSPKPDNPTTKKPSDATNELPAPTKPANPQPLPSVLEKPANSATTPNTTGQNAPAAGQSAPPSSPPVGNPNASSGRIYLGLEAEEVAGGGIGVRVSSITDQSPAWKAKFKVGDRILAINGFAIANLENMVRELSKTRPGQTVKFLISRGGRNREISTVLMDAEVADQIAANAEKQMDGPAWLGVVVNDLTPSFRQQFGITAFRGAAVTSVASGSPADRAGIRAGDAIIEAGGGPVESANDLMAWMTRVKPGQRVELMVYRGAYPRSVNVVLQINPSHANSSVGRVADRPSTPAAQAPSVPIQVDPLVIAPEQPASQTSSTSQPPAGTAPSINGGAASSPTPATNSAASSDDMLMRDAIRKLQSENDSLRKELQQAQQRLLETQRRLDQIINDLKSPGA